MIVQPPKTKEEFEHVLMLTREMMDNPYINTEMYLTLLGKCKDLEDKIKEFR